MIHIEWCEVPAGEFIYGPEPESQIVLSLPRFWIAKYPITYGQFQVFIDAEDGFYNDDWWHELSFRHDEPGDQAVKIDNHPRERVSWYDSMAFANWLEAQRRAGRLVLSVAVPADYILRLPTEQEWEKAARGTDGRCYPYGNAFDPAKGNVADTGLERSSPVGSFPAGASPYGVLDMSGNVWEWCRNDYDNPAYTAPGGLGHRVLRGGSWRNSQNLARATWRLRGYPAFHSDDAGLRIVCGPALES